MEATRLSKCMLYTWGANSYGQLAQGHAEDLDAPRPADATPLCGNVRCITGGGGHSALLTEAGELLMCGQNHKGQLGLGHTSEVMVFHLCPLPGRRLVQQVACGWEFSLILTDEGRVLACGSNAFGQLGVTQPITHTSELLHIKALADPVSHVAAGLRHSLAITVSGHVYQWGTGLCSLAKRALAPHSVPAHLNSSQPCLVPGMDHVTPQEVTTGSAHCVCLTRDGELFLWGSNKHGQLAGADSFVPVPTALARSALQGETVTHTHCGWTHTVVQTESGSVFTWGRAIYGQLGRPVSANEGPELGSADFSPQTPLACAPTEVKSLAGATQIACGSEHNLAIVGGQLFSWGWNEHGMCGDGSLCDITQPQPIPALRESTPLLIGCGAGHSMALCCVKPTEEAACP